jgi:HAE1 family hydrophobic/amphiphilic exporter-1
MSLITSSIRYPVTVAVGAIIAVLGGLLALNRVPIQLTPDVEKPFISVTTNWFGASPEEIEKEIILEQEEFLKGVEGLVRMTSESSANSGSIALEFPVGTDITAALVRVTNSLSQVPSYPDNADQPIVTSTGPFDGAIAWFIVGEHENSGVYVPEMKTLVEELVKPRMERVEGVAKVNIFGGLDQELHVSFDPMLLASSGISIPQMTTALRAENRDVAAGDFGEGKRSYVVRTLARFETIESVEETIITVRNGVPIRIKDVADVTLDFRKPTAQVRHMGNPSIAFNTQRQIGANVLEVMDGLLETVEEINEEILHPRGLHLKNVYSETVYINSAIDLVFSNLYMGSILAILTLFVFLRSVSSVMVIGLSIPISIISAFLTMFLFGRTINVISLAGMAFAAGMVVDNAIVVLENIYRHLQMGKNRWQAAADATSEVWGAVLASTITTIAVFLPILFIQERAAQLFKDIAIAISTAIALSLIVSVTVIPSLSAKVLKLSPKYKNKKFDETRLGQFATNIAQLIDYLNANAVRRLLAVLGVVTVTLGLTWALMPNSEYLPDGDQNMIFSIMIPPPGYNLEELVLAGKNIEGQLSYLWETPADSALDIPGGGLKNFFFVTFSGIAIMGMVAEEAERVDELLPIANRAINSIPGVFGFARKQSLFSRDFAGTRSVQLDISGPDLNQVLAIGGQVFGKLNATLPNASSRPIPGLDLGNPEVRVIPDRARAADNGMTAGEIGLTVNALVDGMIVTNYRHEGRDLDLVIKSSVELANHTQDIEQLPLVTSNGRIVTIGDIANVELRQGPVQINHVERQRTVSIQTALPADIALEEAMLLIESDVIQPMRDQGQIGGLYDVRLSGAADDLSRLRSALSWNFILALALTFLLLAALFQSFVYPLVIMLTVPLATFGGVIGLRLVQLANSSQQLDVLTMLGFVILIGTVINNSILIVHQALKFMRGGMDSRAAVKESVRIRVRPILMSTGTSALGMLPLVLMPGAGSELYRGLGSVVIGGLTFSAVVTLALTPLVFSFAIELVKKVRGIFGLPETAINPEPSLEAN